MVLARNALRTYVNFRVFHCLPLSMWGFALTKNGNIYAWEGVWSACSRLLMVPMHKKKKIQRSQQAPQGWHHPP
jgi:hypothetical protein